MFYFRSSKYIIHCFYQQNGKPVASFKHHTAPITSIEWNPNDSSVLAASGSDDQISIWDLAVEKDNTEANTAEGEEEPNVPPQLLFIHQGQTDIKELHWHPQLPGVIISTAHSGFNVFRTISVWKLVLSNSDRGREESVFKVFPSAIDLYNQWSVKCSRDVNNPVVDHTSVYTASVIQWSFLLMNQILLVKESFIFLNLLNEDINCCNIKIY